jgi:hypothetical protein
MGSLLALLLLAPVLASTSPVRPVATYSIVARDPATGELGVAVQSHWFSVGSVVSWAEAGVGAVATQSFVDPAYGPLGLSLMRAGRSAPDSLKALLAGDDCVALADWTCAEREYAAGVPLPNAYELYQGFVEQGVEAKLVVFKGFGHGLNKPKAVRAALEQNLEWFSRHVLDVGSAAR